VSTRTGVLGCQTRSVTAHDGHRTKRLMLEIYGEVAEAIATGRPYQTRFDPPLPDTPVAHPSRETARGPGRVVMEAERQ
jgi:hypothetical protein